MPNLLHTSSNISRSNNYDMHLQVSTRNPKLKVRNYSTRSFLCSALAIKSNANEMYINASNSAHILFGFFNKMRYIWGPV